jgi:lactate permease
VLVGAHWLVAWEVCGLLATGSVLAVRLLIAAPPRGREGWRRALVAAGPYLALAGVLLGSRLWRDAPAVQPFEGLPALPLNHALVGLWVVGLGLAVLRGSVGEALRQAMVRGRQPALALLMFVLLARFLAFAGVPQALAGALAGSFGAFAPFAAPVLAGLAGFFAGSNVGSNSAMMPLQAELGRVAGLGPLVLPAIQNGTMCLLLSPQVCAIASGLAGNGATPAGMWRLCWPIFPLALVVGMAFVASG